MPGTLGPNLGITWGYSPHEDGWGVGGYNPGFAKLDTLVHLAVLGVLNTPPGSPTNGERYIVGGTPTGVFVGHVNEIAVYLTIGTPGWTFYTPKLGWRTWDDDAGSYFRFDGTAWVADAGISTLAAATDADIVTPAANDILIWNGTDWENVRQKYIIGASVAGVLTNSQQLLYHRFAVGVTLPADFSDYLVYSSKFGGSANATASTVIVVERALNASPNSFVSIGTLTVGAGSITVTPSTSATPITLAKGDVIRIMGPASADATFAGFYATIVFSET